MKYEIVSYIKNNEILYNIFRFFIKENNKNSSNVVVLIKKDGTKVYNPKIKNLEVLFVGVNNYIEIKEPFVIKEKMKVSFLGDNGRLVIDNDLYAIRLKVVFDKDTNVTIGSYFAANDVLLTVNGGSGTSIKIGNGCMFSHDVVIRSSDGHVIYEKDNKEPINSPQDVIIEDHVWMCAKSTVLKGSKVPANCVVGFGSIVTKEFSESNCVIAGIPAEVIKRDINWDWKKEIEWKELNNL